MPRDWKALNQKYFMNTTRRQPITIVKGKGVHAWDDAGKKYLDLVGGWAVCSLGHASPVMQRAMQKQAAELIIASNQFYTIPQIQLAELLVKMTGLSKAFFANSGAEVNEGAFKLARKYGKEKLNGAYQIISTMNSFHGRTLATVAATGQEAYQKPFRPLPEGFINVLYDDISAIKKATNKQTCAIIVELVQGEGGVHIPAPNYAKQLRDWCDKNDILLILDEIQTGFGRLGKMFGYEQFGIRPDIITFAKGMGGGFPIGAFLCNEKADAFTPGDHGSTYGGSPLACAVSMAVIKEITGKKLDANAANVGKHLTAGLERLRKKYRFVKEVRGMGLLLAMEFTGDISGAIVTEANKAGLLLNPVKPNAIRMMPPLILTKEQADEGVALLDKALTAVSKNL